MICKYGPKHERYDTIGKLHWLSYFLYSNVLNDIYNECKLSGHSFLHLVKDYSKGLQCILIMEHKYKSNIDLGTSTGTGCTLKIYFVYRVTWSYPTNILFVRHHEKYMVMCKRVEITVWPEGRNCGIRPNVTVMDCRCRPTSATRPIQTNHHTFSGYAYMTNIFINNTKYFNSVVLWKITGSLNSQEKNCDQIKLKVRYNFIRETYWWIQDWINYKKKLSNFQNASKIRLRLHERPSK